MDFFHGTSFWITPEDGLQNCAPAGHVMLFHRRFQGRGNLVAAISADSEYRLFCNGREVHQGPAFRDAEETFFDRCDLSPYLQEGENELLAEVVGFASAFPDFYRGGCPMARMAVRDAFILDGVLIRPDGTREELSTNDRWEAAAAPDLHLFRCPGIPAAGPGEAYTAGRRGTAVFRPAQLIEPGFRHDTIRNAMLPYRLVPKRIPDLRRETVLFRSAFDADGVSSAQLAGLLAGRPLRVEPSTEIGFVLDMEQETTARLQLSVLHGTGRMEFSYAENLITGKERHFLPQRAHDAVTGPMRDTIELNGEAFCWKSFFYRAFRFVRVTAAAGGEALEFHLNSAERETYPYEWKGAFASGDAVLDRMRELGKRTLELCSHHIYEDCPCYERLQYTADSRIAAQAAQLLSGDTGLTEQAIRHFRHSIGAEGLTAGSYPSRSPVILPLWSLHYILMTAECYLYTGKTEVLHENLAACRRILEWFLARRQPEGGIGRLPYWNIADFSAQWDWRGEPPEVERAPSAYVTFLTAECLRAYETMAGALDRKKEADWAGTHRLALQEESRIFYHAAKGLYADTPDFSSYSLLTNAQSVLAGMPADGALLRKACDDTKVRKAALFGGNFIFQAFLRRNDPEYAEKILRQWDALLQEGRTVFPEGTPVPRSECHVWSALPAFGAALLYTGFRILEPGAKKIAFAPYASDRVPVRGSIPLPCGAAAFDFNGGECKVKLPKGIVLQLADGSEKAGTENWMELPTPETDPKKEDML